MVVSHPAAPVTHKKTRKSLEKRKGKAVDTTIQATNADEDITLESLVDEPSVDEAREDDEVMIDVDPESAPTPSTTPSFPTLPKSSFSSTTSKSETRRVPIPPHRMSPIKKDWINIFSPLTEILGLQVRMNVHRRCVEIRVSCSVALADALSTYDDFSDFKTYQRCWCATKRCRLRQGICIRVRCKCKTSV